MRGRRGMVKGIYGAVFFSQKDCYFSSFALLSVFGRDFWVFIYAKQENYCQSASSGGTGKRHNTQKNWAGHGTAEREAHIRNGCRSGEITDQEFFQKAMNGDKIIVYELARRIILYRPGTGKVIDIVPLAYNTPTPQPTDQMHVSLPIETPTPPVGQLQP